MINSYIPLHVHSDASLLDGFSQTHHIVSRIEETGSEGCALTDHGSIANSVSFLRDMKKANKKAILGLEAYICDSHAAVQEQSNRSLTHLPILAKNTNGWKQLVKIVSESNKPEYFYHKPRLSLEQLSKFLDGNIIGFSGHLGSHVSSSIENYGIEGGIKTAKILEDMFGKGNFWLECQLMDHKNTPKQIEITKAVREISRITGIPCIATPDAHYASKEHAHLQRILLCSNMGISLSKGRDPNFELNIFFASDNFHIPSYEEMIEYGHTKEELENTNVILSQIENYDILKAPMLKKFDCPNGLEPNEYLTQLCRKGWKNLIQDNIDKEKQHIYIDRIKHELDVIQEAGLASYFLMVQDILSFANSNNWIVGPGRGSVAGCLISYLIGITKIDPIEYGLIFARFYNKGRNTKDHISMPDIDVDIPIQYRESVIDYIRKKYGEEHVSQMITFQTMKGARALKEVFRAYDDVPFDFINKMTEGIPEEAKIADQLQEMGEHSIIRWCLERKPLLFKEWCYIDENGDLKGEYADRFSMAISLEGTKAAQSKHAAGIIVSPNKLSEMCPMVYDSKTKKQVAGFVMEDLEAIGLIKFDILGIAMLDKIMCIRDLLKKQGIEFDGDINKIDLGCEKTWNLLSEGRTKGIFQLESRFGQKECKSLKPKNMEQLSALSSILRPGVSESKEEDGKTVKDHYILRKNKQEEVTYIDESLRDILKETYGLMIYQEESMSIAQKLAGFSLEQADTLRKAIGKKLPELMERVKTEFLDGCKKTGLVDEPTAEFIFSQIQTSQRYSFNKSITENTIVELNNGIYKKITNTISGDMVKTPYGYSKVIELHNHGLQHVYKITTELGKTIECTLEHKFLCEDNQIRRLVEIIKDNHKIVCDSV